MATVSEILKIHRDLAEARKTEEADLKRKKSALARTPTKDLVDLRLHWLQEAKRNRKLDEVSIRKRKDADTWLKAIDYWITHPRTGGPSEPSENDNLDLPQAAEYLKISTSTLYKWTSQGKIRHTTVGKKKLSFSRKDLDEFLDARRRKTDEDIDREAGEKAGEMKVRRQKSRGRRDLNLR